MDNQVPSELQVMMGFRSSTGPRELNEDSVFIRDFTGRAKQQRYLCLGAVADGMGGHQAGEVASSTAVQTLFEGYNALLPRYSDDPAARTEDLLFELFSTVNSTVYDIAIRDNKLKGMGTTLTAFLAEDGRVFVAHVGDSRAYLIRGGSITQLTEDHTLVENMVKERVISREEAAARADRNVITRAIGVDKTVEIDLSSIGIRPDDMVLLCTDGLYGVVDTHEILITLSGSLGMQAACDVLVDLAIRKGASDNVTALLWKVPASSRTAVIAPASGTVRLAPGRTNTVSLPPERVPVPASSAAEPPVKPARNKAGVAALIIALIIFAIAGFLVGWLIAGWVKGDDSGTGVTAGQMPSEEQDGTGGPAIDPAVLSARIRFLDAKGQEGSGNAQAAVGFLRQNGFSNLDEPGMANNETETAVYYRLGSATAAQTAKQVCEMLGIDVESLTASSRYGANSQLFKNDDLQVIVVMKERYPRSEEH